MSCTIVSLSTRHIMDVHLAWKHVFYVTMSQYLHVSLPIFLYYHQTLCVGYMFIAFVFRGNHCASKDMLQLPFENHTTDHTMSQCIFAKQILPPKYNIYIVTVATTAIIERSFSTNPWFWHLNCAIGYYLLQTAWYDGYLFQFKTSVSMLCAPYY